MNNSINLSEMSYNELVEMNLAIQKAMAVKRNEEIRKAVLDCMNTYGITKEEMKAFLDNEDSIIPTTPSVEISRTVVTPVEDSQNTVKEALTTPEPQMENNMKEKTPVSGTEEDLPSMEDLLSSDPEYLSFYHPKTSQKNNRNLPTMDELLSGEPINKILCLGNLTPKGAPYRQHTRINHSNGIIPTETATGQTLVYIPKVA